MLAKLSRNIDLSNDDNDGEDPEGGHCNAHNDDNHDNVGDDDDDNHDNVDDVDDDDHVDDHYGRGQNSSEPVLKTVQHNGTSN